MLHSYLVKFRLSEKALAKLRVCGEKKGLFSQDVKKLLEAWSLRHAMAFVHSSSVDMLDTHTHTILL
jgi:hypothetical protein